MLRILLYSVIIGPHTAPVYVLFLCTLMSFISTYIVQLHRMNTTDGGRILYLFLLFDVVETGPH